MEWPEEPTMGMWDDFCAVHPVHFDLFIAAYKAMRAAHLASSPVAQGEEARDAARLDWIFSTLNDDEIIERIKAISHTHAFGGLGAVFAGRPAIRVGDYRAAIDYALSASGKAQGGES